MISISSSTAKKKKTKTKTQAERRRETIKKTAKRPQVDIFIKERKGKTKIQIPWLPSSIEYVEGEQVVAEYDILSRGPVEIPTGTELATISWESQLPGPKRNKKDPLQRGTWKSPEYFDKYFKRWLKKGTPLQVIVSTYPINKNVTLSSYETTIGGAFGDIEYKIEFKEDRDLTISKVKKKKDKNTSSKRNNPKSDVKTYTVKKGDNLWKIAQRTLGSGSSWKKIYTANKSIIESTAKKRGKKSSNQGKYIYPGTVLKIPTA